MLALAVSRIEDALEHIEEPSRRLCHGRAVDGMGVFQVFSGMDKETVDRIEVHRFLPSQQ